MEKLKEYLQEIVDKEIARDTNLTESEDYKDSFNAGFEDGEAWLAKRILNEFFQ